MKIIYYIVLTLAPLTNVVSQTMTDYKVLTKKQGQIVMVEGKFIPSLEFPNDSEHEYYVNNFQSILIYNKFMEDFILYDSKETFKNVLLSTIKEVQFNLNIDFQEKIDNNILQLNKRFGLNLKPEDNLEGLRLLDETVRYSDITKDEIKRNSVDFFSYFFSVIINVLKPDEIRVEKDESGTIIYLVSKDLKGEIINGFIKMINDPEEKIDLYLYAKQIIKPFKIPLLKKD